MSASLIEGARETWTFGTRSAADRGAPIMLWAKIVGNAGAARFSTPRKFGDAAGYAVTAGKTLVITSMRHRLTSAPASFGIGYCDADLGMSAVADGANPVNLNSALADGDALETGTTNNVVEEHAVYFEIPAGKFCRLVAFADAAVHHVELSAVEV